jgi:shikimate 5-dehydrogenase
MLDFFTWSLAANCFESELNSHKATDREHKLRAEREDRQDPRRWELVVNATPVGDPGVEPASLLPEDHFMGGVGRAMDFAGGSGSTGMLDLASRAGLPVIGAASIAQRLAQESVDLWLNELRLRSGENQPDEAELPGQPAAPKRFILKRR